MHQLEGLEQDKTYDELKPLLLASYQTFVTMIAIHSHTGKVAHELTEVRQAVEVEDKARAAAYYRTYLDPTLAEDIAVICGTVNVIQRTSDTNTTIKKQGGHTTGTKNPGKSDRERKCLRCFQAWHPITECEAEKCATCASLHAVQHKDPRCPIFKYAVRYYIAHGELPKSQTFFPLFGVPEAVYKLCFPKSGKSPYQNTGGSNTSPYKTSNGQQGAKRPPQPSKGVTAPAVTPVTSAPPPPTNPSRLPVSGSVHFLMRVDGKEVPCVMDSSAMANFSLGLPTQPHLNCVTRASIQDQPALDSSALEGVGVLDPSIALAIGMGKVVPPDVRSSDTVYRYFLPDRSSMYPNRSTVFLPDRSTLDEQRQREERRRYQSRQPKIFHPNRREWNLYSPHGSRATRRTRKKERYIERMARTHVPTNVRRPGIWRGGARRNGPKYYNPVKLDQLGTN